MGTARAATTGSQEIRQRAQRATPRIIRGSTKEKIASACNDHRTVLR